MASDDYYTIALVPAKIHSRRIPEKNLHEIADQALYVYSVRAGINTLGIDETFVSSESQIILNESLKIGAIPILRPLSLSGPLISNEQVVKHAITQIEALRGRRPDFLVLLQPTHPFRCPDDISAALQIMKKNETLDSLVALRRTDELFGNLVDGYFLPEVALPRNKAAEKKRYVNSGSFYVLRISRMSESGSFLGKEIGGFLLSQPDMEIDIDRPEQLAMARGLAEFLRSKLQTYGLIDP